MMNLKRGSLASVKQWPTRSQQYLNDNTRRRRWQLHTRKLETLGRQHTTTMAAAAAHEKTEILERQQHITPRKIPRNEVVGEAKQQHTAVTTAQKEETIDSKDQELLAFIKKQKWGKEDKDQVRNISKKIKQGIRENERFYRCEKAQNIFEEFKGTELIGSIKTRNFFITLMRNESGSVVATRKGIANISENILRTSSHKYESRIMTRKQ